MLGKEKAASKIRLSSKPQRNAMPATAIDMPESSSLPAKDEAPTQCFFCRRTIDFTVTRRAFRFTVENEEVMRAHFGCCATFIQQAEESHALQSS